MSDDLKTLNMEFEAHTCLNGQPAWPAERKPGPDATHSTHLNRSASSDQRLLHRSFSRGISACVEHGVRSTDWFLIRQL